MIRFWELPEWGILAMREDQLSKTLRAMVLEHGIERVERMLNEIRKSPAGIEVDGRSAPSPVRDFKAGAGRPKRVRTSASVHVSKLKVPDETKRILEEVAVRYEEKAFLPTSGEIRNFCSIYGIEVPASSSRVSAVPRIFRHLATLGPQEIRSMLREGSFSGPSRLAPIAAAIRRSSEHRHGTRGSLHGAPDSSSEVTGASGATSPKPPVPSRI